MKTYIASIIPKINKFSRKLDDVALLTEKHWIVIDELSNSKYVYIFRNNSELLISRNGLVEKGKWEYLGNNSILIENNDGVFLFRHGFFDSNILALKIDGKEEYAFLINETLFDKYLNSIEAILKFLKNEYLDLVPNYQKNNFPYNQEIEYRTNEEEIVFDKDLNIVKNENRKYGFMNKNKILIIDYLYDSVNDFHEGAAVVVKTTNYRDYYGFVNETGKEIVKPKYEFAENFNEGLALVRLNRKFGFINNNGDIVIKIIFDDADSFKNGKAKVKMDSRTFYIDKEGVEILNSP